MAIRLRKVEGMLIALCAAETDEMPGDVYLDDGQHYALSAKFWRDYQGETINFTSEEDDRLAETQKIRDAKIEIAEWLQTIDARQTREVVIDWPEAVSDGLLLPCGECGVVPQFDYMVDDPTWKKVAPKEHRLSVICLPCFDRLAVDAGVTHDYLIDVQFVGAGRTWALQPTQMYVWSEYDRPQSVGEQ